MTENIIFIKIEIITVFIICGLFLLWLKKGANGEDNSIGMFEVVEVLIYLVIVIVFVITY